MYMNLKESIIRILREELLNESDPKTGTGKKPKGSGRRLYTDENPSDTVSVKFRTKEDIVDTLNKESFKSKTHKRQSQIINLIHQRVRAAYQNAKDPETKKRLKRAYDYISQRKEKSKEKTKTLQNESEITEKCWKGYTQKGFKTMFGKRYPNCVKKESIEIDEELDEYSRTLKNARKHGVGLRFPKSAIKANPSRFRPYTRKKINEETEIPLALRRRISFEWLDNEFLVSLNMASERYFEKRVKFNRITPNTFSNMVISRLIEEICYDNFEICKDSTNLYNNIWDFLTEHYSEQIIDRFNEIKYGNIKESILSEVRVPRDERVELYRDDNIIVVVPLTHRALQKYAHKCQWCINDDKTDWEDYHQGQHAVIIQRNPKKLKMGITGNPTASEILIMSRWDEGGYKFRDVCEILGYEFKDEKDMGDYYVKISDDINNFATNIVYYSPENGLYDMEDNSLWSFNIEINDIPNVTSEVIKIMDDYLKNKND